MRLQLTGGASLLLGTLLATSASAQNTLQAQEVNVPVRNAGTYHVASGTWTRANTQSAIGPAIVYNNRGPIAYFTTVADTAGAGTQFDITDNGRLPGTGSEGDLDVYDIDGITLAYCTDVGGGPGAMVANFGFDDAHAPCSGAGAQATATVSLNALPSGIIPGNFGCWVMEVDFAGAGNFNLVAEGEGIFDGSVNLDSFGYTFGYTGHGASTATGPILFGDPVGSPKGDGTTNFGFGAGPNGTGIDQQDFFWIETPLLLGPGCYFFGGYAAGAPWGGFYVALHGDEAGGPGVHSYCGAGSLNSTGGAATLTSAGGYGTAGATFDVIGLPVGPDQPGILYSGPNQLAGIPFGCGIRCVGGTTVRGAVNVSSGGVLSGIGHAMTTDTDNVQYWYRDPANFGACGGAFNLSDAIGL